MKLCKDCKHFRKDWEACKHPNLMYTNLVTGNLDYKPKAEAQAKLQRSYTDFEQLFIKSCGKAGSWFEAKEIQT